jgi:hypothetical protein
VRTSLLVSFGAHTEFICLRERAPLAQMLARMMLEYDAAICDGAILALGGLRGATSGRGR